MSQDNKSNWVDGEMIGEVKLSRSSRNSTKIGLEFPGSKFNNYIALSVTQLNFIRENLTVIDAYIAKHGIKAKSVSKKELLEVLSNLTPEQLEQLKQMQKAG